MKTDRNDDRNTPTKERSFRFHSGVIKYGLVWSTGLIWGIFQSLLGFLIFLLNWNKPHFFYHGMLVTIWNHPSGSMSLGLFIFLSRSGLKTETKGLSTHNDLSQDNGLSQSTKRILVHEFGHSVQSLLLGPLYLPVIGILSLGWNKLPMYRRLRRQSGRSYYSFWPEAWANRLGEKITGQQAPDH